MCTGVLPFRGETSALIFNAILERAPVPPVRVNPDLPIDLERTVNKCLEKDRDLRYQHAADIRTDLQRLKRDTDSSSGFTVAIQKGRSWYQRPLFLVLMCLLVVGIGAAAWRFMSRNSGGIHSLAVMPFTSRDSRSEELSDEMDEAIIETVSQVPDVRVMSRGSVVPYKSKQIDPQQVGRDLNVEAVLTGQLVQQGDEVRFTTELTKTADGSHLWGKQYGGKIADILALQQNIAAEISQQLRPKLTRKRMEELQKLPTQNPEAYQLYVKGAIFLTSGIPKVLKHLPIYFSEQSQRIAGLQRLTQAYRKATPCEHSLVMTVLQNFACKGCQRQQEPWN